MRVQTRTSARAHTTHTYTHAHTRTHTRARTLVQIGAGLKAHSSLNTAGKRSLRLYFKKQFGSGLKTKVQSDSHCCSHHACTSLTFLSLLFSSLSLSLSLVEISLSPFPPLHTHAESHTETCGHAYHNTIFTHTQPIKFTLARHAHDIHTRIHAHTSCTRADTPAVQERGAP